MAVGAAHCGRTETAWAAIWLRVISPGVIFARYLPRSGRWLRRLPSHFAAENSPGRYLRCDEAAKDGLPSESARRDSVAISGPLRSLSRDRKGYSMAILRTTALPHGAALLTALFIFSVPAVPAWATSKCDAIRTKAAAKFVSAQAKCQTKIEPVGGAGPGLCSQSGSEAGQVVGEGSGQSRLRKSRGDGGSGLRCSHRMPVGDRSGRDNAASNDRRGVLRGDTGSGERYGLRLF